MRVINIKYKPCERQDTSSNPFLKIQTLTSTSFRYLRHQKVGQCSGAGVPSVTRFHAAQSKECPRPPLPVAFSLERLTHQSVCLVFDLRVNTVYECIETLHHVNNPTLRCDYLKYIK